MQRKNVDAGDQSSPERKFRSQTLKQASKKEGFGEHRVGDRLNQIVDC